LIIGLLSQGKKPVDNFHVPQNAILRYAGCYGSSVLLTRVGLR
jgi:hypothetical protein